MMMTDIFARRNSTNKNKLLQKKSVAAYSIQDSPNFNISISAPDICLYESILIQSMSPYPLNNALIHFMYRVAQHGDVLRRVGTDKNSLALLLV